MIPYISAKGSPPHQKKLAFLSRGPIIPSKIILTSLHKPHKRALFERGWWSFFAFGAASAG
jgi:hypothetical protein